MKKRVILSKAAPAPVGPYSQGIESGGFIFLSGQIPMDAQTGALVEGGISSQAEAVMENIGKLLEREGMSFENIVKSTIFITDMSAFPKVNEIYSSYFKGDYPARSTVEVSALPKGALVEIEVIAAK